MKKLVSFSIAVLLLFSAVIFSSCTGGNSVDLKSVLSDINKNFSDSTSGLTELSDVSELTKYYEISEDDVKQFAAEINTDVSTAPIEIVIVEANNSDAEKNIKQSLENRYNSIYGQYASYSAEQFDMVKDCGVTENGNFVILIVAEDYDDILELVNSFIEQ